MIPSIMAAVLMTTPSLRQIPFGQFFAKKADNKLTHSEREEPVHCGNNCHHDGDQTKDFNPQQACRQDTLHKNQYQADGG